MSKINGPLHSVEFVEWVSVENDEKIACIESIYTVINDKRILKSKSESYWDSEQGKYIELDTKYY